MSKHLQSYLLEKNRISNIISLQKKIRSYLSKNQEKIARRRRIKKTIMMTITTMEVFLNHSSKISMASSKEEEIQ